MTPAIRVEDIAKSYTSGALRLAALQDANFVVDHGEFVTVTGASGSGKSTLLNLLGCLDRPSAGHYYLDGREVSALDAAALAAIRNEKLGFVFQAFNLLPRLTAQENVELPLVYAKTGRRQRRERSVAALERVGLGAKADRWPGQLSGGEQQRVAIARALVNEPTLILADEPTGALDSRTGLEIILRLQRLNEAGVTVVLVTHDETIAKMGRRGIRLRDGRIESDGAVSETLSAATVLNRKTESEIRP